MSKTAKKEADLANLISGDVRGLQVQQGANRDQQQESMQRGIQLIMEIVWKT